MRSNAGVQPASMVVVPCEDFVLNHICHIVHSGADLPPYLDLLQCNHHCSDGALSAVTLGKEVPKLHREIRHKLKFVTSQSSDKAF